MKRFKKTLAITFPGQLYNMVTSQQHVEVKHQITKNSYLYKYSRGCQHVNPTEPPLHLPVPIQYPFVEVLPHQNSITQISERKTWGHKLYALPFPIQELLLEVGIHRGHNYTNTHKHHIRIPHPTCFEKSRFTLDVALACYCLNFAVKVTNQGFFSVNEG